MITNGHAMQPANFFLIRFLDQIKNYLAMQWCGNFFYFPHEIKLEIPRNECNPILRKFLAGKECHTFFKKYSETWKGIFLRMIKQWGMMHYSTDAAQTQISSAVVGIRLKLGKCHFRPKLSKCWDAQIQRWSNISKSWFHSKLC